MSNQRLLKTVKELLPQSEVFPEYIRNMLTESLTELTVDQLKLLLKILAEERGKMDALKDEFNIST